MLTGTQQLNRWAFLSQLVDRMDDEWELHYGLNRDDASPSFSGVDREWTWSQNTLPKGWLYEYLDTLPGEWGDSAQWNETTFFIVKSAHYAAKDQWLLVQANQYWGEYTDENYDSEMYLSINAAGTKSQLRRHVRKVRRASLRRRLNNALYQHYRAAGNGAFRATTTFLTTLAALTQRMGAKA